jgi:sulfide:quinone oxidoreductase
MRVVVLGAGFGGLELTTRLSEDFGDDIDVVLIDQSDGFVFGFSKLDVMFGRALPSAVWHPYRDLSKPGVHFVQSTVQSIDPVTKRVQTDAGTFDADILVVALGADLHPTATPGLVEGGHEFYTVAGAFALRDILAGFEGGRVIVGVTSTPFKCPPAPSETALLIDDYLTERGLRDSSQISLVMPLGVPIPPSPAASEALLVAFAERGIDWHPDRLVRALDPVGKVAILSDGSEMPYDLFLGVPVHRAPAVVEASGMTVDGWIPVNPLTLETAFPGVYSVGDVTSVGTPKAGVFAEGQAAVVADGISALIRGTTESAQYDGRGMCYLEFGHNQVARVDVAFFTGGKPTGDLEGPSEVLAADKVEFGSSRILRWFGRTTVSEAGSP